MYKYVLVLLLGASWRVQAGLWPKGVVHYAINTLDYDINSQEVITSALAAIEKETCLKFFHQPLNYTTPGSEQRLYISNPEKRKTCPPDHYYYNKDVVVMPIGYKCINKKDIARIAMDMLRASVDSPVRSQIEAQEKQNTQTFQLLAREDRRFIQENYAAECRKINGLASRGVTGRRTLVVDGVDQTKYTSENAAYYDKKIWPFGIVMYGFDPQYIQSPQYYDIKRAMAVIELTTCIVFQDVSNVDVDILRPNNLIWFTADGEDVPHNGFKQGNQSVNIESMVRGAVGHQSHLLSQLLRALGLYMESNRHDRDLHIKIQWQNIERGKEHLFEKALSVAALRLPYDFDSATHAPVNWQCGDACATGERTVVPYQDHLWRRTRMLGHRSELSPSDVWKLSLIYDRECQQRYSSRPHA